jgi:hypothetical protein
MPRRRCCNLYQDGCFNIESLYADDVFLFIRLEAADITITMDILHLVDVVLGLKTNIQKSNVLPIICDEHDLEVVHHQLPCALSNFPCKYLSIPLALEEVEKGAHTAYH